MPRGIPAQFPSQKRFSLYEGVDYSDYWRKSARARQDALERHLVAALLPARGRRIVDLGCGYGRLAPCYAGRFDEVVLYDGSMSLLQQARRSAPKQALLVAGDVTRLPFRPAAFDAALCIRVLQHLHDPRPALAEARRVLAAGGSYVFSYHNKRNLNRILNLHRTLRSASPFSTESAAVLPTIISHHPRRFRAWLAEAGFGAPAYRGALVLGRLARFTERLGGRGPSGSLWAGVTGRLALAPWLVGRATAERGEPWRGGSAPADFLQCPACEGALAETPAGLACRACAREYPRTDGILDFRL